MVHELFNSTFANINITICSDEVHDYPFRTTDSQAKYTPMPCKGLFGVLAGVEVDCVSQNGKERFKRQDISRVPIIIWMGSII